MTDHRIPLIVVGALAIVVVLGGAWMGYLASTSTAIPDQLDRLVVGALGGLVGILATTRGGDTPQRVTVENEETDAIPTTDIKPKK